MRKKTNRNDLVKATDNVAKEKWDYHLSDEKRWSLLQGTKAGSTICVMKPDLDQAIRDAESDVGFDTRKKDILEKQKRWHWPS